MEAEKEAPVSHIPSPWVRLSVLAAYLSHRFSFYQEFSFLSSNCWVTCVYAHHFHHIFSWVCESTTFLCNNLWNFMKSLLNSEIFYNKCTAKDLFTRFEKKNHIWKKEGERNNRFLIKESQKYKEINKRMEVSQTIGPVWNNFYCKHKPLVWKS